MSMKDLHRGILHDFPDKMQYSAYSVYIIGVWWVRQYTRTLTRTRRFTHGPEILATRNTSYLTASKSLNGRKIARMAPILTIFGQNRSRHATYFLKKSRTNVVVIVASSSCHRRRHRRRRCHLRRPNITTCGQNYSDSPLNNYFGNQALLGGLSSRNFLTL